jgi:hypothetical protein
MKAVDIVKALEVVKEQAEDESLWVHPETIVEDHLQRALRRLHAAIEGDELMLAELEKGDAGRST